MRWNLFVSLLAVLVFVVPSQGAIALVNHTWNGAPTNVTTTAMNCSGANLATIVVVDFNQDATSGTMTSNPSNTWHALTNSTDGGTNDTAVWYAEGLSANSTMTFTYSGGSFPAIFVACWSGAKSSSAFDQQNQNFGTPPLTTGSVTPSENNELVIAGVTTAQATETFSIDGGFTKTDESPLVAATNEGGAMAYLIQTTATIADPVWTLANSTGSAAAIATFKAAAASTYVANPTVIVVGP